MKKLIDSLSIASKHLSILDDVFMANYPLYAETSKKLHSLPLYDELRKEIYVGGKRSRGKREKRYGRQMILGDLLQYIFTGRGYYFAVKGVEQREAFISIIMYVCNLLLLMEDVSADVNLRRIMMKALRDDIGAPFFEEKSQKEQFEQLSQYQGLIIPGEGRHYENCLDSMLPKRVGAVPELLVYAYFIRKYYGYLLSLLHSQRILGNQSDIVPPDFLLLRSKGQIFGIEVGAGKEAQMSSFSLVTSIPVFSVGIGNSIQPQPYRCGRCYKWIIYCDEVIRLCSKNKEPNQSYVDCNKCSLYKDIKGAINNCPFIVYYGEAYHSTGRYAGKMKKLRYHYNCVKNEPEVKKILENMDNTKLIAPIPRVYGLRRLTEEPGEPKIVAEDIIAEEEEEETPDNDQP
jgi:hypothetical protein